MEGYTIIYICGTVLIISILVLIFVNFWVSKYYNYLKENEKEKCLKEELFCAELSLKIDNLIYIQKDTIEKIRKDRNGC